MLLIASFSFLQMDCKKDEQIIPPEDKPSIHPTIVWTADTIQNPYPGHQLMLTSIWGSDTNNIYAIGYNGYGGRASLFHYDGNSWNRVILTLGEGGFIKSYVDFNLIEGSGKNDIWAVGSRGGYYGSDVDSTLVIHYDGVSWKELEMPRSKSSIQGLKVFSPNNVYFGGSFGEIYHYDGTSFTKTIVDSNVVIHSIGGDDGRIIAGASTINLSPNDYHCVFSKYKGGSWQLIKKATAIEYYQKKDFGTTGIYSLGGDSYFVSGYGVYSLAGNNWSRVYADGDRPFYQIKGLGKSDIYAQSGLKKFIHWNGVDWQPINTPDAILENRLILALWVDTKYVYLSYNYSIDKTIIFKGLYKK